MRDRLHLRGCGELELFLHPMAGRRTTRAGRPRDRGWQCRRFRQRACWPVPRSAKASLPAPARHHHIATKFVRSTICVKSSHSGTPAIRQAWPNFSTSSSRRNGELLMPETRKAGSVCRTASHARRASAMRPAIARLDISIRCAPGKFGWRWMALVARDRASS